MRRAAFAALMPMMLASLGLAEPSPNKGGPPPQDISVTTEIQDLDANNQVCTISSDGQGVYQNGLNGVVSILTANTCNGLTWGDWRFNATASGRSVTESFFSTDAIQPGDPHFQAPASPPYTGSQLQQPMMNVQCTCSGSSQGQMKNMYTMTAGQSFTCPLLNHWGWSVAPAQTFTGYPETTDALVTCNAASGGHCVDWFIEPIGAARPSGTDDEAVGRVVGPPTCKHCGDFDGGDFYMRFRIHVTLP